MSVVAVWVFSSRSLIVCGHLWYTSDFRWPQKEKCMTVKSRDLGGHLIVSLHPTYHREELKFCTLPVQWSGAPSCWKENWHCAISGVLSTCISSAWLKNWRYCLVFTTSSGYTNPRRGSPCIVDHTVVLVLIWWCAATVTWGLSCSQCIVLCQFIYPCK